MVEETKENIKKCICKSCPSKNQCMNDSDKDFLYCAKGKTECEMAQKGCICGACPIHAEYKLKNYYYCVNGKAK